MHAKLPMSPVIWLYKVLPGEPLLWGLITLVYVLPIALEDFCICIPVFFTSAMSLRCLER